jgi:hypothetical protein
MKRSSRLMIATGIVILTGLFGRAAAQSPLPSDQGPTVLLEKYKEQLRQLPGNSHPQPVRTKEQLPSARPVSVKGVEAEIKRAFPVPSDPLTPAAVKKLPGNMPPAAINKIPAKKMQIRPSPPLQGNQ